MIDCCEMEFDWRGESSPSNVSFAPQGKLITTLQQQHGWQKNKVHIWYRKKWAMIKILCNVMLLSFFSFHCLPSGQPSCSQSTHWTHWNVEIGCSFFINYSHNTRKLLKNEIVLIPPRQIPGQHVFTFFSLCDRLSSSWRCPRHRLNRCHTIWNIIDFIEIRIDDTYWLESNLLI